MTDALFDLLPAIHRLRDGEAGDPLRALLEAIGREFALVGDDIDQLYGDMFVETADAWALPYIGALVDYLPLAMPPGQEGLARAEVAQTIALRRRKGTLSAIEATARNATGMPAKAAEFFPTLARTQYMNRALPHQPALVSMRNRQALAEVDGAFGTLPRHVDVRRIESARGRHNIPNIGVFLWPVRAYGLTLSPAVAEDAQRLRFSPLGHDMQLFHRPAAERDIGGQAEPLNVPRPISRDALRLQLGRLYGPAIDGAPLGLDIRIDGVAVPASDIRVCRLDNDGATWLNVPTTGVTVDPELGRLALPPSANQRDVHVTCHYGFSADLGGGEYPRAVALPRPGQPVVRVPTDAATIAAALAVIAGDGVIELEGSDRYAAPAGIEVAAGGSITLRAATNGVRIMRPLLDLSTLGDPMSLRGDSDSAITLEGLLVAGGSLEVPTADNSLVSLDILHCTLVPGRSLGSDGTAVSPTAPSLGIDRPDIVATINRSICGGVRLHRFATLAAVDSIIDATGPNREAIIAPDGTAAGFISLDGVTLIGRVHATAVGLITDSLLVADPAPAQASIHIERRQEGCVRHSWLPVDARTPRRFRCLPDSLGRPSPHMLSRRFGGPVYARLDGRAGNQILRAAADDGEIGAFAHLGVTRLLANLAIRLAEQVPAGAELGVFQTIEGRDP